MTAAHDNPQVGPTALAARPGLFPVGAAVTLAELAADPHPRLHRLREREPVSWLPALGGWLVTSRDLVLRVLRDSALFTVDDPRFSTARVVGPSMLSLDGAQHGRHRDPFSRALRAGAVGDQLAAFTAAQAERMVAGLAPAGRAELRRSLAGPLAVAVVAQLLGLDRTDPAEMLSWYDAIVAAVSALAGDAGARADSPAAAGAAEVSAAEVSAAGAQAFSRLSAALGAVVGRADPACMLAAAAAGGGLTASEAVSNAAVLMFGGIETTEGMISSLILHLLSHPGQVSRVTADPGLLPNAVEESIRLEPAAAVVDRYATAAVSIGGAAVGGGDLVTVSLAGANRDPAFFTDPDRFDIRRANARLNLAFAHGPHFCLGAHLARLEATAAASALLGQLPGLRLDPARPAAVRGLVFRKPDALHVLWDAR